MSLTNADKAILQKLAVLGHWYVDADNLVPTGRLIERGYAAATDDYEGPQSYVTAEGVAVAKRLKLIEKRAEKSLHDYNEYTFAGGKWLDK